MTMITRMAGALLRRRVVALAVMLAGSFVVGTSHAADAPLAHVEKREWTFGGIFGQYDQAQLQRGFKVFREACATCHAMKLVPFRALGDPHGPHFSEEAVKQIASEYRVQDISNETGLPFERIGSPTDHFPSPYPNKTAAVNVLGAYPPDLSLMAKARAAHRGFPGFVVDAFAGYAENGPDYIYALLTHYEDPPADVEPVVGSYYNPIFTAGPWIKMPPPLRDGQVAYTDGSPETIEQYSADISAFLMWAAEPELEERKEIGFRVMVFLVVFAVLLYLTKRKLWRNVEH